MHFTGIALSGILYSFPSFSSPLLFSSAPPSPKVIVCDDGIADPTPLLTSSSSS